MSSSSVLLNILGHGPITGQIGEKGDEGILVAAEQRVERRQVTAILEAEHEFLVGAAHETIGRRISVSAATITQARAGAIARPTEDPGSDGAGGAAHCGCSTRPASVPESAPSRRATRPLTITRSNPSASWNGST